MSHDKELDGDFSESGIDADVFLEELADADDTLLNRHH